MSNEAPAARSAGHAWFTREATQRESADKTQSPQGRLAAVRGTGVRASAGSGVRASGVGAGAGSVPAGPAGNETVLSLPKVSGSPRQRLYVALRLGATVNAAAAMAGVSVPLAEVMIDEMRRQGLLERAESLCASGLGACGGGTSDEVKIHCAGCPIL